MLEKIIEKIPTEKLTSIVKEVYLPVLLVILPLVVGVVSLRIVDLTVNPPMTIPQDTTGEITENSTGLIPAYNPDEETLERIKDLVQQDIEVGPNFDNDRNNPFNGN